VRESFGLETYGKRAEKSKGSIRRLVQHITARSRDAFVDEIQRILVCDRAHAEKKFTTARTNKSVLAPVLYHEPTGTWRGHLAPEPTFDETSPRPLAEKQQHYWEMFSSMPWLNNDQRNLESSEAVAWVSEKTGVDRTQAAKLIHQAFGCSRDKAKIPFQFRVVGDIKQIAGKEYIEPYILTDEGRDNLVNMEGVNESSFDYRLRTTLKIKETQVAEVSSLVFSEGLLVRDSENFTQKDTGEKCAVICGKNWLDKRLASRRSQLEAQMQKEAQQAKAMTQAVTKEATRPPHGWPEKLNGNVDEKLIFQRMTIGSNQLKDFVARAQEFIDYYQPKNFPTAQEIVDMCLSKRLLIGEFSRGNKMEVIGYKLAA
jgi:hypothetical protein